MQMLYKPGRGFQPSGRDTLKVKRSVQHRDSILARIARDDRDAAIIERDLSSLPRGQPEQAGEVDAIDHVMRYDEQALAFIPLQKIVENRVDSILDLKKILAARIAVFSRIGHVGAISLRLLHANLRP